MISRRNFFTIFLMMMILLFMFQFSMVIKENGNEYDIVPITFEANVANWDDEYREITDSDPTSL